MQKIDVKLVSHTPLSFVKDAIRTCWDSNDKSDNMGEKDRELIEKICIKNKHSSTMEHLVYNFYITGISRLCLQELARHRIASYSVKSTRYTLRELRNEDPFISIYMDNESCRSSEFFDYERSYKYIQRSGDIDVDAAAIRGLENVRKLLVKGKKQDVIKYALPESYRTQLAFTINARSLRNFLDLRGKGGAHFEIKKLAHEIYKVIPVEHKLLFADVMKLDEIE